MHLYNIENKRKNWLKRKFRQNLKMQLIIRSPLFFSLVFYTMFNSLKYEMNEDASNTKYT